MIDGWDKIFTHVNPYPTLLDCAIQIIILLMPLGRRVYKIYKEHGWI